MSTNSEASSPSSTSFSSSPATIQFVSKSKSERLLQKFYDSFDFDYEHEENGRQSTTPTPETAYDVGSAAWTEEEMVEKLRKVMAARRSAGKCNGACFHVWSSCISLLFVAIFKKRIHRQMREITYHL